MDNDEKLVQSGADRGVSAQEKILDIPEASFTLFISSLVTQTLINLGEVENPFSKETVQNLGHAKFTIDTLQIIKDKTTGNLTEDETKLLSTALYDLRMRYVEKSK